MIIQVGLYPPPIGGVSVYNKRFKEFLDKEKIENELWDYSSIKKNYKDSSIKQINYRLAPIIESFKLKSKIIHYHIPGVKPKETIGFLNKIMPRRGIRILTHHGSAQRMFDKSNGKLIGALNTFDAIICVKKNDAKLMIEKGLKSTIVEIPAFIPPDISQQDFDLIPIKVWKFIDEHSPIIALNGANYNLIDGIDLYGMDLTVLLAKEIIAKYPNIGFVFFRPYVNDEFLGKIYTQIKNLNLQKNFLIIHDSVPFYPAIIKSDIFLRPTLTDGDAVSIREALHFKTPVITSDAVERPEGCVLFKKGSLEDLCEKTLFVLNNLSEIKAKIFSLNDENYALRVLNFYRKLTGLDL